MIEVYVNGLQEQLEDGATVADLLAKLAVKPLGLAVEINREVVPRSSHASTQLSQDDRIEIVRMVAGG